MQLISYMTKNYFISSKSRCRLGKFCLFLWTLSCFNFNFFVLGFFAVTRSYTEHVNFIHNYEGISNPYNRSLRLNLDHSRQERHNRMDTRIHMISHDQTRSKRTKTPHRRKGSNMKNTNKKKGQHSNNRKLDNLQKSKSLSSNESLKTVKQYSNDDISKMTIGQAIQESSSLEQLLLTASRMWIPTDDNLPQHIQCQSIHHERRFRSACLLLEKISEYVGVSSDKDFCESLWSVNEDFKRVVLAATLPFVTTSNATDGIGQSGIAIDKECKFVSMALVSLYVISGHTLHPLTRKDNNKNVMNEQIRTCIHTLIERAEMLSSINFTLNQAIETRWAIRGLHQRIHLNSQQERNVHNEQRDDNIDNEASFIMANIPKLNHRVRNLPFDIIPQCINWYTLYEEYSLLGNTNYPQEESNHDVINLLLHEIPFQFDTITTRSGSLVQERRSTAWIAENGIGSLAYSGKLMNPHPIPSFVCYTMRQVENAIIQHDHIEITDMTYNNGLSETYMDYLSQFKLCIEENGRYFDCALTNHYPSYDSACKFHTDPEHGSFWERLTCVVSAGNNDIRKFAFRPIPKLNNWFQWDDEDVVNQLKIQLGQDYYREDGIGIEPVVMPLFPGDCVKMWGSCNDVFHHAVYGADEVTNSIATNQPLSTNNGRVSLVFKRAIDRGNGRKGHGQKGDGRRSRRI